MEPIPFLKLNMYDNVQLEIQALYAKCNVVYFCKSMKLLNDSFPKMYKY